ncbi:MAG TPA: outer membrane beta-barrel protein [Woeseiaceae bacterium]|nr:outer membrane beta-barrel protein [Woeseiaceae bacterium]
MLSTISRGLAGVATLALIATSAHAGGRPDDSSRSWFGQVAGGWSFANGDTADILDDDWNFSGGALFWPSDWPIGLSMELAYSDFDLSGDAVRRINDAIDQDPNNDGDITGGGLDYWQVAVNGIWSLGPDTANGFYLTGGVGWYSVEARVEDTGLVYYPPICDPWYWWCYPGGVGPGTFIVGSQSSDEFGWNLGAGYSFDLTSGQLFIEARYHMIQFGDEDVEFVPLTVGYRF